MYNNKNSNVLDILLRDKNKEELKIELYLMLNMYLLLKIIYIKKLRII